MNIPKIQLNKFNKHVLSQYPKEACAIVVSDDNCKLKVINCENNHEDPLNHFRIDASVIAEYVINNSLKAVLHSHIAKSNLQGDIRTPSANDIQAHIDFDIPFGIVATDGITVSEPLWLDDSNIAPLEGRTFIHGVQDCYTIVRDYFRIVHGFTIKNFARDPSWWVNGGNLCNDAAIISAGLVEIAYTDLCISDLVLMQIGSQVPNHWAVVVGNNKILHQLPHRLSCADALSKWRKYICKCYRSTGLINNQSILK